MANLEALIDKREIAVPKENLQCCLQHPRALETDFSN